jgi:hypothetical protein
VTAQGFSPGKFLLLRIFSQVRDVFRADDSKPANGACDETDRGALQVETRGGG